MEHYWTTPIKTTFNQIVEKRTMNGETIDTLKFSDKQKASEFLNEVNYYINNKLVLTTN